MPTSRLATGLGALLRRTKSPRVTQKLTSSSHSWLQLRVSNERHELQKQPYDRLTGIAVDSESTQRPLSLEFVYLHQNWILIRNKLVSEKFIKTKPTQMSRTTGPGVNGSWWSDERDTVGNIYQLRLPLPPSTGLRLDSDVWLIQIFLQMTQ